MNSIIETIDRFNKVLGVVLALLIMVMSAVIFYQVFSRFVLEDSLRWSEELARYIMVWSVFIGSALAIRKRDLISVDAIKELMSARARNILNIAVYLVSIGFLAILVNYGFVLVGNIAGQLSPAMNISMAWAYSAIPVGSALMIINCVAVILEVILDLKGGNEQ
ncbi:TRAP transporter small permease [Guptibacillus algicola]|uniref:TRAP transporter small permease n=1 Tax=Guptibacillus algicola TaxID=225844 RepID=UPI001CD3B67B|nr:TRAP transporter small permease [Alkalihalobacillus algicola]MCA0987295.1 TRAP transporter small permease [Alkalihalobacillus algicola]